jgi:sarcosine oxidase
VTAPYLRRNGVAPTGEEGGAGLLFTLSVQAGPSAGRGDTLLAREVVWVVPPDAAQQDRHRDRHCTEQEDRMSTRADVAIVGIGSMGSMAAWQLAARGAKVIGFEQFAPGHDRSAHGGESRIFRTAYLEGPEYVPLLQEARRLWRQLEQETGQQLLTLNGGLMIAPRATDFLRNVTACIERFDLPHELLDPEEATRHYPQHRFGQEHVVVLDQQAGYLRPELAVLSAARRAEELGAELHRDVRVEAVEETSGGVRIRAGGQSYEASRVIVTAGPWSEQLLADLPVRLEVRRLLLTWFVPRTPSLFTSERFPIFIREDGDEAFWGIPMLDGFSVKVSAHRAFGRVADPDALDRSTSPQEVAGIRAAVTRCLPDLVPDPVRIGVYQDAFAPDDHFIVGRHPLHANVIVLCGFSGHGFKMASAMGRVASDLALDGGTALPIEHLSPARFLSRESSAADRVSPAVRPLPHGAGQQS